MDKMIFLASLALTTACATSDRSIAPAGGAMNTQGTAASDTVAFAASADGTRIAFEKTGTGPALIIVGGALSHRGGGKPLARELDAHFTIYTYDRRGRGQSGDQKPYSVERELEDLGAIIEAAGKQAYVYGVSSGAALALQGAAKLGPTKVQKLAIYEPPYGQDERAFNEQKQRVDQLVQTGQPGDAAAYFLSAVGMPAPAIEKMQSSPEWATIERIDFTLAYDYAVLGDGTVPDTVKQITVPVLVMNGDKSMPFMPATADRVAQLVPNAQRETLDGQTHQAQPEVVAPVLIEFFGEGS